MNDTVENYVRKILRYGSNIQNGDDIYVYSNIECLDLVDAIYRLKDEYGINKIYFVHENYEELYNFLTTNPSEEKIKNYVKKIPEINDVSKTKIIYVMEEYHSGYYKKLCDDYLEKVWIYYNQKNKINKHFFDNLDDNMFCICIDWPNKYWAKSLLGSEKELPKLFEMINSAIPDKKNLKEEIQRLKEIKYFLNKSDITNLHFYTNLGTDLSISLTNNSIWCGGPRNLYNQEYFYNFPSYELFTAPNCYSANGTIIIAKPSSLCGEKIKQAKLVFEKGKLVAAGDDNRNWHRLVSNLPNIDRIGEIALVANDSPIAKTNYTFDSLLLDENSGCHLALGTSFAKCINVPEELLNKNGYRHYRFNYSDYHQDLVFGNESTFVEAKTRSRKNLVLMENGKWKI